MKPTRELTMNDFNAARIHRENLDREIESIRTERVLRARAGSEPGLPSRARNGLGRGLISLGTAILGAAESAAGPTSSRNGRVRA